MSHENLKNDINYAVELYKDFYKEKYGLDLDIKNVTNWINKLTEDKKDFVSGLLDVLMSDSIPHKLELIDLIGFLATASDERKDYWLNEQIKLGKDYNYYTDEYWYKGKISLDENTREGTTTYSPNDVTLLLKEIKSSDIKEMSTEEREKAIQSGVHYSEMLPQEKEPSSEYEALYNKSLNDKKEEIAEYIAIISEMIYNNSKPKNPIIVSLVRAGLPVGILIKRYLKYKYNIEVEHYGISIIRDKGIDIEAMNLIYDRHRDVEGIKNIFFVDGWTGKGAIKIQLEEAVRELKEHTDRNWNDLKDDLYVLADPAYLTEYCGTHDDFLLPSACLNSTVSGLISRSILNKEIQEKKSLHGTYVFNKFRNKDHSIEFIDTIWNQFKNLDDNIDYTTKELDSSLNGMKTVEDICKQYSIKDYKKVKPGIGETTRVLLRRIPWKVLINTTTDMKDPDIQHILVLCKEKNVPIENYTIGQYKVCGIIKELADA